MTYTECHKDRITHNGCKLELWRVQFKGSNLIQERLRSWRVVRDSKVRQNLAEGADLQVNRIRYTMS